MIGNKDASAETKEDLDKLEEAVEEELEKLEEDVEENEVIDSSVQNIKKSKNQVSSQTKSIIQNTRIEAL